MKLPNMIILRIAPVAFAWLVHHTMAYGDNLSQEYCSTENTGSEYSPISNMYMSNGKCFDICKESYAFAVVQYKSCWCSNYAPKQQQDTGDCDTACPGFPGDQCGNSNEDLYGYISLYNPPWGTQGASSSTQAPTSSQLPPPQSTEQPQSTEPSPTPTPTPTPTPSPSPTTVVSKVTQIQTQTQKVTTTQTQDPEVVTSYVTPTMIPSTLVSSVPTTSLTSGSSSSSSSPSPSPTLKTSVRTTTISGSPVTQTVTTTPIVLGSGSSQAPDNISVQRQPLSIGAVAGIVVGSLIGIAALLVAAFFLWRRKKTADSERGSVLSAGVDRRPRRNMSILSKTGLLARNRPQSMAEIHDEDNTPYGTGSTSVRHSMMLGAGATVEGVDPVSPLGSSQDNISARRHSRPLVYDQRLNPSALFANADANGSRVSIQDQNDYSRPLGIANPDFRPSFDSR